MVRKLHARQSWVQNLCIKCVHIPREKLHVSGSLYWCYQPVLKTNLSSGFHRIADAQHVDSKQQAKDLHPGCNIKQLEVKKHVKQNTIFITYYHVIFGEQYKDPCFYF